MEVGGRDRRAGEGEKVNTGGRVQKDNSLGVVGASPCVEVFRQY